MGVSEWWCSVVTRAHGQQKSEALVAWEDMQEVKAQLAEAREHQKALAEIAKGLGISVPQSE